jgi:acetyl-CoA C-acetyltransferase
MFEAYDCFSVTEMVTMEDLHLSPKGGVHGDIMGGFYDLDGEHPCQMDDKLKCFGHPIGASGLRMI